jgi:hypothetical protein
MPTPDYDRITAMLKDPDSGGQTPAADPDPVDYSSDPIASNYESWWCAWPARRNQDRLRCTEQHRCDRVEREVARRLGGAS